MKEDLPPRGVSILACRNLGEQYYWYLVVRDQESWPTSPPQQTTFALKCLGTEVQTPALIKYGRKISVSGGVNVCMHMCVCACACARAHAVCSKHGEDL